MIDKNLQELADILWEAKLSGEACGRLTDVVELSVEDAYSIQKMNVERSSQPRVGWKIGLTSEAVQTWLNVNEPDFGHLLDDMAIHDGGEVLTSSLMQPRAEAEIAFVLAKDLIGPVSVEDVIEATAYVLPAIEIIDSRIKDWKITYFDTVADNASSGLFVLGKERTELAGLDLRLIGMSLWKNGKLVSTGAGAACLENPLNAVAWLANKLTELGSTLKAGEVVLSGALGPVTPVELGDVLEARMHGLGACSVRFT